MNQPPRGNHLPQPEGEPTKSSLFYDALLAALKGPEATYSDAFYFRGKLADGSIFKVSNYGNVWLAGVLLDQAARCEALALRRLQQHLSQVSY